MFWVWTSLLHVVLYIIHDVHATKSAKVMKNNWRGEFSLWKIVHSCCLIGQCNATIDNHRKNCILVVCTTSSIHGTMVIRVVKCITLSVQCSEASIGQRIYARGAHAWNTIHCSLWDRVIARLEHGIKGEWPRRKCLDMRTNMTAKFKLWKRKLSTNAKYTICAVLQMAT